ncbi:hypothetical protein L596_001661 [Steinernema carpocapsae]|uniref:Myb-like domain-containing protein n=1 Tax=Steinernema carpocapsae TaxID=34508 RepID=A0A4U8UQS8_STECR|nr:hypothetical protein L596_001661 [Steinernema carpocapsae]
MISQSSMEGSTVPHEAPPKRGRGRPKKSSMEVSTAPHEAPPKRGRGRPKKSPMEGSTAPHEAPPKRGRGRPKGSKNKIAAERNRGPQRNRRGAKSRAAAEHEAEAKRRRVTRSPDAELGRKHQRNRSGATSNAEAESEESQEVKPLVPDVLKFSGRPERESEEWTPEDDYHLVNAFHKYSTWHYDGTQYRVKVLSWRYISDRVSFHSAFIRSPLQCHDRFSLIGNPTWPPPSVDVFAPFVPDAPPSFVEPIDPENVPPRERLGLWNRHAIGLPDASHCFRTRGLVRRVRLLHRRYRSNPARRTLR